MAAGPSKGCCKTILDKFGLKPLTQENVFRHYFPMAGVASYTTLAVYLSNRNILKRICPNRDVTNILLVSSVAGTAFYIYYRPHLEKATNQQRIVYSVCGATMLSLSSILAWAIVRSFLPDNACIHTISGVTTSLGLLIVGKQYLDFVDGKTPKSRPV